MHKKFIYLYYSFIYDLIYKYLCVCKFLSGVNLNGESNNIEQDNEGELEDDFELYNSEDN